VESSRPPSPSEDAALVHDGAERRLKSDLLANLSHELRSPLNAIIGFSSLLQAGKVGALSETQTEYLGDILTSSRRLLRLINDVVDLAKLEAARLELRPESVDVGRVVGEVNELVRGLQLERRLEISVQVGEGLDVVIDPRLLKRVLYDCLSNAIKLTPDSGHIDVRVVATSPAAFTLDVRTGDSVFSAQLPRRPRAIRQGQ